MPFEKFLIHNSIITQAQKDVEVQKLKPPAIQSLMFMFIYYNNKQQHLRKNVNSVIVARQMIHEMF